MIIQHDSLTYLIDCHDAPKELRKSMSSKSGHVLIIDCVKWGDHPSHLGTNKCIEILNDTKPEKAYLTHLGHDFEHYQFKEFIHKKVGQWANIAYDTLNITYS